MNEEQGQRGDDGRVEEVIRVEGDLNPFDLLPDELLEIIIAQSLSGLSRGSFVRAFTRLQNVCSLTELQIAKRSRLLFYTTKSQEN